MWLVIVENFKHSFDQITFRMALSKNYHNSDGSRSDPKVLFFPLVLNKKMEMKAQSTVAFLAIQKSGLLNTRESYFSFV